MLDLGFYQIRPAQGIDFIWQQMLKAKNRSSVSEKTDELFNMAKNLIMVDRTEWLADIV